MNTNPLADLAEVLSESRAERVRARLDAAAHGRSAAAEPLHILLTNDDGYNAPGITSLREALVSAGFNVTVVAPAVNQSAQGSSFGGEAALDAPISVTEFEPGNYDVDGKPSVATLVGLQGLLADNPPDLVISGTNRGENSGQSENISGTVNAAVQAIFEKVPAIAVSAGAVGGIYDNGFAHAAAFTVDLVNKLIDAAGKHGAILPDGTGLSVNVPGAADLDGVAITTITPESTASFPISQTSPGVYGSSFVPNTNPSHNPTSEGSEFLLNRITVSAIDGNWGASELDREALQARLGDLLQAPTPDATPLDIMLVDEEGTDAAGLKVALNKLTKAGYDVTVVAPATDQGGVGSALTLGPITVTEYKYGYKVGATPATTVETGLDALLKGSDRPDLVVSGIGDGANVGAEDINHSGTVAAAITSLFNYGLPSIAIGADGGRDGVVDSATYNTAAKVLLKVIADLSATETLGQLLPTGLGLNINVAEGASGRHVDFTLPDADADGSISVSAGRKDPLTYHFREHGQHPGGVNSDVVAIAHGDVSISPIDGNFAANDIALNQSLAGLFGTSYGIPNTDYQVPSTAPVMGTAASQSLFGSTSDDAIHGLAGEDELVGLAGADAMFGGKAFDVLLGGAGSDGLHGNGGGDVLAGDSGSDRLFGNRGGDAIAGGGGADTLVGGQDDDAMAGNAGADVFHFRHTFGADTVSDFEQGVDVLNFGKIDRAAVTATQHGGDTILTIHALDASGTVTLSGITGFDVDTLF